MYLLDVCTIRRVAQGVEHDKHNTNVFSDGAFHSETKTRQVEFGQLHSGTKGTHPAPSSLSCHRRQSGRRGMSGSAGRPLHKTASTVPSASIHPCACARTKEKAQIHGTKNRFRCVQAHLQVRFCTQTQKHSLLTHHAPPSHREERFPTR